MSSDGDGGSRKTPGRRPNRPTFLGIPLAPFDPFSRELERLHEENIELRWKVQMLTRIAAEAIRQLTEVLYGSHKDD
jgi:hypothetical protein